jgi:hypothetical protein
MKGSDNFKQTIREYLEKRGAKDPLFAQIITKPGKNMDDCVTHILNTVQKSGCNGFTDDEIYGMAIHYFDEDNLKVDSFPSSMRVVVNHQVNLTDEEKVEAKAKALKKFEENETIKLQVAKLDAEKKAEKALEKKKEKLAEMDAKTKTLF